MGVCQGDWNGRWQSVLIEPALRLFAKPAGLHIVDQEWRGPVFGIPKVPVEHLHDAQTSVQADEVGQRQRTHGHVGAQLHCLVDVASRGDALLQNKDGLVDVGHEDTVGHKAWSVLARRVLLVHGGDQREGLQQGSLVSAEAPDHLHQLHHRHRVHEVHPDDTLRALHTSGQLRDGDRRGVARKHAVGPQPRLLQHLEDRVLHLEVLADSLNDEVEAWHGASQRRLVANGKIADPSGHALALRLGQPALLHLLPGPISHELAAPIEARWQRVQGHHLEPGVPCRDNRNASAHLARADDTHPRGLRRSCSSTSEGPPQGSPEAPPYSGVGRGRHGAHSGHAATLRGDPHVA
mmetsp:Transcript_6381/g.14544  ORF Transcript_6381/g.14544 Transcript_6381/m.14544 type:complete len:350 (+) Transcript_6381:154-1203(+)